MTAPKFFSLPETLIIGLKTTMSLSDNKTFSLWNQFMPRRNEIKNKTGEEFYSIEQYPDNYFKNFNPNMDFIKWAGVRVSDFSSVPDGMDSLIIPHGDYAVFLHKGPASKGFLTYQYIFQTWLPTSGFEIDPRPHFALMDQRYKHESEESQEDIYVPVRKK